MGQFGLNLDEDSLGFSGTEGDRLPLSHEELQKLRARICEASGRSSARFTIGLFAAGFAVGFLLLYIATGLHGFMRSSISSHAFAPMMEEHAQFAAIATPCQSYNSRTEGPAADFVDGFLQT